MRYVQKVCLLYIGPSHSSQHYIKLTKPLAFSGNQQESVVWAVQVFSEERRNASVTKLYTYTFVPLRLIFSLKMETAVFSETLVTRLPIT